MMSEQLFEEFRKIDEYLDVIQKRIVEPIQKTDIDLYCTATLLLLFAAIDGLGKLIHEYSGAGSGQRIRAFLCYMGDDYRIQKDELYNLRNSLVHNAMNVASYMSQTQMGSDQHLRQMGSGGFIYVNTSIMYNDFTNAFDRLRQEFRNDEQMMHRAADRLEWREDDYVDQSLEFPGAPPPPVEFIWAR